MDVGGSGTVVCRIVRRYVRCYAVNEGIGTEQANDQTTDGDTLVV